MNNVIALIKKISHDLDETWQPQMEDMNLHTIFYPIYHMLGINISDMNRIVCFIVYAYDNDSQWLNLKQDRYENKLRILKSLSVDTGNKIFTEIAMNENEIVNKVIGEYIIEQTDWRWQMIMSNLDYSVKMIRFANQKTDTEKSTDEKDASGNKVTFTEDYDIGTILKVNKEKGLLLQQAIEARERADKLLAEIRKEIVMTEHAVQSDFNFSITDDKKIDPTSWRQFTERRNELKKKVV